MKVYARYFEENGLEFRRDTILQFGNRWDLIGSIILINPGSATPLNTSIQPDALMKLLSISQTSDSESWKEFSIDPTMRQIDKLFRGQYIGYDRPLNGVIQLFNLFNLRNQNLSQALELFKSISNFNIVSIENDIKKIGKKPVYLGWGSSGKNELRNIAKKVFEILPKQPYLYDRFEDNSFYHPQYLQRSYKTNGISVKILHDFYNQNKEYKRDGAIAEKRPRMSKEKIKEIVKLCVDKLEKKWKFYEEKNNRFAIANKYLSLTVTHTGGGYIAIRYMNDESKADDKKDRLEGVLAKYNFDPYINDKGNLIWIGTKKIEDFAGNDAEEISCNIISELTKMVSELDRIYPLAELKR